MKAPNNGLKLASNYEQRQLYTSRETTPRQRRIQAERKLLLASYHELVADILGGIALAILIVLLFLA